jgi:predicted nuclease with TOPRIM domain
LTTHRNLTYCQRRRAQNRASQRAFRERKEKHVKGLENQLEDLHEKHQDLLQSFSRQAGEVSRLNSRISELNAELNALRSCQDQSFSEMLMPEKFDKFDAFAAHDMLYTGPESYFDKSAADLNSEFALHSFEDSL